jgi:uncharacterized membrane protein YphA (DoxX/SURF4 family)
VNVTHGAQPPAAGRPSAWQLTVARIGRALVGLVFLVAAVGKAMDPVGFGSQIDAYGWLPGAWTYPAAIFFIAVEFLLAAALLVDFRPRLAAAMMLPLVLVFLVVLTEAWYNERAVDCGCFGELASFGPGQEALADVGYLILLLPTFLWGARPVRAGWRLGTVAAVAVLGLGFTLAAPRLPLDDLLTRLTPGADVAALGMEALVPEQGAVLIGLLDLEAEPSVRAVPGLNDLALEVLETQVLAFAAAGPEERFLFSMEHAAGFPLEEVGATTLGEMARRLPRFALLVDGEVVAVWNDQPPDPQSLRAELEGGTP